MGVDQYISTAWMQMISNRRQWCGTNWQHETSKNITAP